MTGNAVSRMTEEDRDKIAKSMLIETYWMAIRTMVDMIGSESTVEKVRPHFRNGGHAFALNMMQMFGIDGNDIETIDEVTSLFEHLFDSRTQELSHSPERIVKACADCPFAGAPPEACVLAHEMMYRSICEQINPNFDCRFTQMMTKGDPVCSWVIEKKK
jgi:predicted hydrocarbon binding protein